MRSPKYLIYKSIPILILLTFIQILPSAAFGMSNILMAQSDVSTSDAETDTPKEPITYLSDIEVGDILTLQQALDMALGNNSTIKQAEQAIEIGLAAGQGMKTQFLPDLGLSYSWTRYGDSNSIDLGGEMGVIEISPANNFFVGLMFSYPIYSGGRERYIKKIIDAGERAADFRLEQVKQLIEVGVIDAYCAAREAYGGLAVQRASLEQLNELLRSAELQYENGLLPLSDLLSIRVAQNEAAQKEAELVRLTQTAQSNLNVLIGAEISTRWSLPPVGIPVTEIPLTLETLTEWALGNRPELKSIDAEIEALEAQIDAAKSSRKPRVSLDADATRSGSEWDFSGGGGFSSGTSVSGKISIWWDLYDFGAADDHAAQYSEQIELLKLQRVELEQNIRKEVEWAFLDIQTQIGNIKLTETGLEHAKEAYRVAKRRQEEGLGLMVEVLSAEAAHVRLSAGNVLYTHMYYRAVSHLARAVGMPISDLIALTQTEK